MREDERRYYRRMEEDRARRREARLKAAEDRVRAVKQMKSEGEINRINASIESRGGCHEERPVSDDPNSRSEKQPLDGSGNDSVNGSDHVKTVFGDRSQYESFIEQSKILLDRYDVLSREILRGLYEEKPTSDE